MYFLHNLTGLHADARPERAQNLWAVQAQRLEARLAMDDAIVRWRLSHKGRTITCTAQVARDGLDVQVTYDSLPVAAQRCQGEEDAIRWSDQVRRRWEARGWGPDATSQVA